MATNGPKDTAQETTVTVDTLQPKKQVATKTHKETLAEFAKSRKLPKEEFRAKNQSEMEGWRSKLESEEVSSEMQLDKDSLEQYPVTLERAIAPEGFQAKEKGFDEVAAQLFEDFSKLSLVSPFAPKEPVKPVVEKREPQSGYLTSLWSAPKSAEEVKYESEMKAYEAAKKKHDTRKKEYDARHAEIEKLKSTLDSVQRNFEKLSTFEPSLSEKTIQADLGLSAFKDAQQGVVSQFMANKHHRNNFARTIKEDRERALEAQKQAKLQRAVNARSPVSEDMVALEMEEARERRNVLKVK